MSGGGATDDVLGAPADHATQDAARLSAVEDTLAITEVLHRYALHLDNRDWERLTEVFTDDAVAEYLDMPRCDGRPAIQDTCSAALGRLTASQHLIGNVTVTLEGDTAESVCYLQAQHVLTGTEGGDTFTIAGRYRDTLTRTPHGWRILHRRLEGMWTAGNPAVVRG